MSGGASLLLSDSGSQNEHEIKEILSTVDDTTFKADDWNIVIMECGSLAAHWHHLSICLGLSSDVIKIITANHSGDISQCWFEALDHWIKMNYKYQKFGKPSWKNLVKAIASVDKSLSLRLASHHQAAGSKNDSICEDEDTDEGEVKVKLMSTEHKCKHETAGEQEVTAEKRDDVITGETNIERSTNYTSMATQEAQEETTGHSTHYHDQLTPAAQQTAGDATNMESSLKTFCEQKRIKIDDEANTGASDVQASVLSPTEQNTRAIAREIANVNSAMLLIPPSPDSPLIKRNWIGEDSWLDDDKCSLAEEKLKTTLEEVKSAGKYFQECLSQSIQEVADCKQKLQEYKEKRAKANDRKRDLRQCYELETSRLETTVAKLEIEKKEENTKHQIELINLQHQHIKEIQDLQHTIQVQATYCRELDTKFNKLESNYAKKEQHIAKMREKLKNNDRELETIKDLQKKGDFAKLKSMLLERASEEMEKKFKTCLGISELVSRLPNVTDQAEHDSITKQVISKLQDISRTPSATKSISWH